MPKTAAVIGTGFSGICAAIKLKKTLNIRAELFELSTDVGGTWRQNTYPGAECDIPSHLYSLSFELNPNWANNYSGQAEIHEYLRAVARKYNLYEQTRFESEVILMEWVESRKQWLVQWRDVKNHKKIDSGYYDFVFAGLGPLRIPHIPEEFKGFEGPIVHTTYWDSTIDYTNKCVAVVGSGASAVQVIPELRKIAAHVYSYQRTPSWIIPRGYALGCKRVCRSEVFLEACAKPNVTVIHSGVVAVNGRTVVDKDGNGTEVDILVLATGFDIKGFAGNLKIYGIDRRDLLQEWQSGFPMTYKSVSTNGFPNAFFLLGPSTGLGHNSVVVMIECSIKLALQKNAKAIEPTVEAQDNYVAKMKKNFIGTTWKNGCRSYYLNEQGEPYALWPNTVTSYWWNLKQYDASDFNFYS
ncbi:hypothetical protein BX666DRAFT_1879459 [Dichotomocladium elegans]|nr:hypothetical protein BX666DRAFT_1879459 [Dichotomocladium elegans]